MLNEFIKRLLMMRLYTMEPSRIELLKQEQFLIDTDFIAQVQDCEPDNFYAMVKKNAMQKTKDYTKVLGSSAPNISEDTLQALFGALGFGNIQIMQLNREKKHVFLQLLDSPIVKAYKKMKKKSAKPVCLFVSAVLAGAFSAILEKDVNCEEKSCAIKGGKKCDFVIQ